MWWFLGYWWGGDSGCSRGRESQGSECGDGSFGFVRVAILLFLECYSKVYAV